MIEMFKMEFWRKLGIGLLKTLETYTTNLQLELYRDLHSKSNSNK